MKNVSVCSWSYRKSIRDIAEEMRKIKVDHIQLALTPFIDPKAVVPGAAGETSGASAPTGSGSSCATGRSTTRNTDTTS